jgi:hypothetical protein
MKRYSFYLIHINTKKICFLIPNPFLLLSYWTYNNSLNKSKKSLNNIKERSITKDMKFTQITINYNLSYNIVVQFFMISIDPKINCLGC